MISCVIDKIRFDFINFEVEDIGWIYKCCSINPYLYNKNIVIEKVDKRLEIPDGSKIERKTNFILYHVPDGSLIIDSYDGNTMLSMQGTHNLYYSNNNVISYLKSFLVHKITIERYKLGWTRLHGSSIYAPVKKSASIFLGNSGTGKSSTAYNLITNGLYEYISDDVVFVKHDASSMKICGINFPLALMENEIDINGLVNSNVIREENKVLTINLSSFDEESELCLNKVFVLELFNKENTYIKQIVNKQEAIELIIPHIVTNDIVEESNQERLLRLYRCSNQIVNQCEVYRVELGYNRQSVYERIREVL